MGKPPWSHVQGLVTEYIGCESERGARQATKGRGGLSRRANLERQVPKPQLLIGTKSEQGNRRIERRNRDG